MTLSAQTPLTLWLAQLSKRPKGFSSHSQQTEDKIFVALKGERVDGHSFIANLVKAGNTCGYVVDSEFDLAPYADKKDLFFVSKNVHETHRELAHEFRKRFPGKIIAVGGSSGKTSTKEFLHQLLSKKFRCFATEKSQNGELGIPKTLEKLDSQFEIGIIEVGIDAPGDMIRHAELVNPDIAILTSIGEEHLNLLHTIENVFTEEKILFDVTSRCGGSCFAPLSDPYLSRLKGITPNLHLVDVASSPFKANFSNAYAKQNALLAAHVAQYVGMNATEIQSAIETLVLPEGRGRELLLSGNRTVIADHYNANPSSLKAGLSHLNTLCNEKPGSKILILGDMLDLGEGSASAHHSLIEAIQSTRAEKIVFIGPEWKRHEAPLKMTAKDVLFFENSDLAAQSADWKTFIPASSLTLVKGSRGMKLEKVLEKIQSAF